MVELMSAVFNFVEVAYGLLGSDSMFFELKLSEVFRYLAVFGEADVII